MSDSASLPPRIRIRSYQPTDHDQVVGLFTTGLMIYASVPGQTQEFWNDYIATSLQGDMTHIEETYFTPGGHYWVAVAEKGDGSGDEEIAGMVALQQRGNGQGELRRMSVKAEYRRFGVGKMLVTHLEKWAAANGYTRVYLAAGYAMERAHHFYKSLGFTLFADKLLGTEPHVVVEGCFEKILIPTVA